MDGGGGGGAAVAAMLLQEAQQEIASLRSDLYSNRRVAEERRVQIAALTDANNKQAVQLASQEGELATARTVAAQLTATESQLKLLTQAHENLRREFEMANQSRKILQVELGDERKKSMAADEQKALVESERSRLQKSRDDLSAQLRLALRRSSEAEEEQMRAEEEAATLRAELDALHQGRSPGEGGSSMAAIESAIAEHIPGRVQSLEKGGSSMGSIASAVAEATSLLT
eukprot:gene2913-17111_t